MGRVVGCSVGSNVGCSVSCSVGGSVSTGSTLRIRVISSSCENYRLSFFLFMISIETVKTLYSRLLCLLVGLRPINSWKVSGWKIRWHISWNRRWHFRGSIGRCLSWAPSELSCYAYSESLMNIIRLGQKRGEQSHGLTLG